MRKGTILALVLAILPLVACRGGSGDGDGDADVDADVDADADGDSDTDGGDCGSLDGPCCPEEPGCMGDLICAALTEDENACLEPCDPGPCDYGEDQGYCVDGGSGDGVCAAAAATSVWCEWDGCETEYGVSEATRCVQDPETFETFCFESCELRPTGCDETTHACVALTEGGGVCRPR
jgi:hypothetical protein